MRRAVKYEKILNKFPSNVSPISGIQIKLDMESCGFEDVTIIESPNYYDGKLEWCIRGVK